VPKPATTGRPTSATKVATPSNGSKAMFAPLWLLTMSQFLASSCFAAAFIS